MFAEKGGSDESLTTIRIQEALIKMNVFDNKNSLAVINLSDNTLTIASTHIQPTTHPIFKIKGEKNQKFSIKQLEMLYILYKEIRKSDRLELDAVLGQSAAHRDSYVKQSDRN